jgi:F0F1-type ATP synthase assembly protein I
MANTSWMKPLQLGWVIALWLTLGVAGGLYIDKRFSLTPFGIVAGSLLAFAACGYSVYRAVLNADKDESTKMGRK